MSHSPEKSGCNLIAELCDGRLNSKDAAVLSQLLSSDRILQEEYLDQLLVAGLLQYEFGMERSSPPQEPSHSILGKYAWKPVAAVLGLCFAVLVGVGGRQWFELRLDTELFIPLVNTSFESASPIFHRPTMDGWYGDVAHIVRETQGNTAHDGRHMLQLIRSVHQPAGECEVYQAFDLSPFSRSVNASTAYIEATVAVNARANESGKSYILALELYITTATPLDQESLAPQSWNRDLLSAGKQVAADTDRDSWQEIKLIMPLSQNAKFGILKISVRDDSGLRDEDFSEIFVDNVQVRLRSRGVL